MDINTTLECETFMNWISASFPSAEQVSTELYFLSEAVDREEYSPKALNQIINAVGRERMYFESDIIFEALDQIAQQLDDIGAYTEQ